MFHPEIEIQIIAILISAACALCGCFLFLRKMTMMADSITHTILLGIVLAFFVVKDLNSPALILAAAAMGLVTVWLTELVRSTKLVSEDSSIGVVFPLLFSIAIILISRFAGNVHLDTDSVLLGELAFAPFDRMELFGADVGAKAIYVGLALLLINVVFVKLFYKELMLSSFDPVLSAAIGFSPTVLYYALMSVVSITTVGSFEAVGSILVIAFMAGPPACAYLLTEKLKTMLLLSLLFALTSAVLGLQLALQLDVSIAGMMAASLGLIFLLVLLFSPKQGLLGILLRRRQQKRDFLMDTFILHVNNHTTEETELIETGLQSIGHHLNWPADKVRRTVRDLNARQLIYVEHGCYHLTEKGQARVRELMLKLYPEMV